ncbi:hypothetical protein [Krasilnikovia sp. MM14-A1259]|uniref:hypothetical protein n=1 Tax=Krasilnikovia sp. MM14-A1259 TaxID=3373539 RepID=UPI00380BA244
MALTGLPLIALAVLVAVAAGAATVRFWSLPGRWRLPVRVAGVLLAEALVVASAGLVLNRHEQFYPSWAALAGDTGTRARATVTAAGRLDDQLGRTVKPPPWRPAGWTAWRLATAPVLLVPPAYRARRAATFPALLELVAPGGAAAAERAAAADPDAVRVVLVPTGRTAAAALANLPAALARDVRVTSRGWAVVATSAQAGLAAGLVRADQRFSALALVGAGPAPRPGTPGVAVRNAGAATGPAAAPVVPGVAVRRVGATGPAAAAWALGDAWAAEQTPQPLAAPVVLPTAVPR